MQLLWLHVSLNRHCGTRLRAVPRISPSWQTTFSGTESTGWLPPLRRALGRAAFVHRCRPPRTLGETHRRPRPPSAGYPDASSPLISAACCLSTTHCASGKARPRQFGSGAERASVRLTDAADDCSPLLPLAYPAWVRVGRSVADERGSVSPKRTEPTRPRHAALGLPVSVSRFESRLVSGPGKLNHHAPDPCTNGCGLTRVPPVAVS